MKVNQIVSEHKKGVRAMKYGKKTKGAVPVYGPDSKDAKLKPVKPTGTVSEDAKITKTGPDGVEITADTGIKTTLPADKAAALQPDPQNPNEYDLNPAATSPTGGEMAGPKIGANVEIKTAEAAGDVGTMPTAEFVKGIYSVAAEYGNEAPDPEAIKQQMVLTPGGEVDMQKTFEKIYATFQAQIPQIEQLVKDLEALLQTPAAQQAMNPEVARIQELAFAGVTQHDNGDTSYEQGPISMRKNKDGSSDMTATLGDTTARVQQNPIGVKTMTAQGSAADAIVGTDASARRLGVDPSRVQRQLAVKESAELTAMLTIAGLR